MQLTLYITTGSWMHCNLYIVLCIYWISVLWNWNCRIEQIYGCIIFCLYLDLKLVSACNVVMCKIHLPSSEGWVGYHVSHWLRYCRLLNTAFFVLYTFFSWVCSFAVMWGQLQSTIVLFAKGRLRCSSTGSFVDLRSSWRVLLRLYIAVSRSVQQKLHILQLIFGFTFQLLWFKEDNLQAFRQQQNVRTKIWPFSRTPFQHNLPNFAPLCSLRQLLPVYKVVPVSWTWYKGHSSVLELRLLVLICLFGIFF